MNPIRSAVLILVGIAAGIGAPAASAQQHGRHNTTHASPYSGEQGREITSLSEADVQALLSGAGMGLAKPAELNSYPGPRHVLDLGPELTLTPDQQATVRAAFERMHADAVRVGGQIVEQERALGALFREGSASDAALRDRVDAIGRLQAELRYVHLRAHLDVRGALTAEQVRRYDELRGYAAADRQAEPHGSGHNHQH